MNSRLLLLFLIIASFIAIWSDDQKKTDLYLASLQQKSNHSQFTLNCFPEYEMFTKQLLVIEQWSSDLVNFNPSELQSLDITIKQCFPSSLITASLCPAEELIAVKKVVSVKEVDSIQEPVTELKKETYSYLKTASKFINWINDQSSGVNPPIQDETITQAEAPLMDRLADEIVRSLMESSRQIQLMTETYQQAIEKIERTSKVATNPETQKQLQ